MRQGALVVACCATVACHDFDAALNECVAAGNCAGPDGGGAAGGSAGGTAGGNAGGTAGGTAGGAAGGSDGGIRYAFQTSVAFTGDLGGVSGADRACTDVANDAGLNGPFVALVSLADAGFEARLTASAGGWWRTDARPFASDLSQLRSGRIYATLDYDERGRLIDAGTMADRALSWTGPAGGTCQDWASASASVPAGHGNGLFVGPSFIDFQSIVTCNELHHLYCVSNMSGPSLPRPSVPAGGRRAFVSAFKVSGDTGRTNAEVATLCDAEAASALGGGWLPLRGLTARTPWDEAGFDGGTMWYRVDGAPLAASAANLVAGRWLTGVALHADGGLASPADYVWTGVGAQTCGDWSGDAGAPGTIGNPLSSRSGLFAGDSNCNTPNSVYCVER